MNVHHRAEALHPRFVSFQLRLDGPERHVEDRVLDPGICHLFFLLDTKREET